ncbi:hypothetical protein ACFL43_00775 [Thermodesulfobacteriota bacterium]
MAFSTDNKYVSSASGPCSLYFQASQQPRDESSLDLGLARCCHIPSAAARVSARQIMA